MAWRERAADAFFPNRSPGWAVDLSGLLLVLIGCAIDLITNPVYSPLPFFLLPVIYVAWFSSRQVTGWLCIGLMATSNFIVAYFDHSTSFYIDDYNSLTRIATLGLVYWIVRKLRASALELREAKTRLEHINREKDLLFGVISHDLRSALGVMLASSRLMKRAASLPEDQIRLIADRNQTAAQNSLALLEDLLEWSRLQISGAILKAQAVPIAPLVHSCVEGAAHLAEERRIRVVVSDIPPSLAVLADQRAIRAVLRNLIGNALKFTGENGEVRVAAGAHNGSISVSVKDNGIGISKDTLQQLLSGTAAISTHGVRGETGAGFGLSMCKDILERFGGRLMADSAPGRGSEFQFSLPRGELERLAAE